MLGSDVLMWTKLTIQKVDKKKCKLYSNTNTINNTNGSLYVINVFTRLVVNSTFSISLFFPIVNVLSYVS